MQTAIIGIASTLLTSWIIWVSYTIVETQNTVNLVDYKLDLSMQAIFGKEKK